jgi:bifunctional non-homologous end joining protein LigD
MLAQSADELPIGPAWIYEVKWDGYRAIAAKDGARVRLLSRNQKDLTRDYPGIEAAIAKLSTPSFVLDGEIVALDAAGRPSFQALQHRSTKGLALVYVTFDILSVGDESLIRKSLETRRRRLHALITPATPGLMLSEPLPGSPKHIEGAIREDKRARDVIREAPREPID